MMNVFVLCTGRSGSVTFANACAHISNYSSAHESRIKRSGPNRLDYPDNHIEVDNRLSWVLGRLDIKYGDNAFYVHLRRDRDATARSFLSKWETSGAMKAYAGGIAPSLELNANPRSPDARYAACLDYCDTVTANIGLFLRPKTKVMELWVEYFPEQFAEFWELIGARGDYAAGLAALRSKHNSSRERNDRPDYLIGLKRIGKRLGLGRL